MRYSYRRFALFSAALVFSVALSAKAAPGDLDPTFGTGGTATDFLSGSGVTVNKVILQPDGKIIVVGTRKMSFQIGQPAKDYLFVRRYTSTGTLDTVFSTTLKPGIGFDAGIQPDGKLVVIGQAPNTVYSPLFGGNVNTTSPVVWRFNVDGTVDTNFGSNGARFINAHSGGSFNVDVFNTYIVILYASRSVYTLGDYSYKVSRLSQDGSTDYTVTLPFSYAQNKAVRMKLDQLTSDVVVLGDDQLRRYTIEGAVATGFGSNGVAPVPYCFTFPNLPLGSRDLEIQPDGGILVLRVYAHQYGSAVGLSRQTSGGTADPSVCESVSSPYYVGSDLLLQPDGRFFFYDGGLTGIRFAPDGNPATNVANHTRYPQVIQPDQKLVTAWATSNAVQLTRRVLD